jgi:hypothetical protein
MNGHADSGYTWRISHGEIVSRGQWNFVCDANFSTEMHKECSVRHVDDLNAIYGIERLDQLFTMF